jgi:23S rRNA C2498 (ribose-2'-O)-methylase RlmM
MAFRGKNICTTGLSGEKNAEIARKCAEIGAFYDANFTENTDFLIAECGGSQKYIVCAKKTCKVKRIRIPTFFHI